ncbi:MAG: FkbM family methyltransferase [Acidaminococcales bacterium]|jgi:FkbM family methyltransferase|nr:FkbM family methyltransferase [Acidaminococcales bacterium]
MKLIKRLARSLYKRTWPEEFRKISSLRRLKDCVPISTVKQWREYYAANDVDLKKRRLLSGIGKDGKAVVDDFLRCQTLFMDLLKESDYLYFEPDDFIAARQKEEREKINYAKYRKHFAGGLYDTGAVWYHSGLKRIPFVSGYIKGKDFIDGGAFTGDSALGFEGYAPNRVYSFEPLPVNQNYLRQTIKINNLKRVLPVHLGLGDKKESLYIKYNPKILNSASLIMDSEKNTEKAKIDITTLDDFAGENKLDVGLIKLDVEGFEMKVIRGAQKTIREKRPVLLISIYHGPEDFFEIKPLVEAWGLRYKFEIGKMDPFGLWSDVMLLGYPEELTQHNTTQHNTTQHNTTVDC